MTQYDVKLFISHSSKTEENLTLLKKVCDALSEQGFDVLVDKSGKIPEGEEWFRYLGEWMAECNAAVILFSRAAFEQSDWVRAEATILSWRKRVQPEFKLVGVLLDDVKPEEFEDDHFFKTIRISDFQFVRDFDTSDHGLIVNKISQALAGLETETLPPPFQELARMGRDILGQLKEQPLKDAWNSLNGIDKPQWQPKMDYGDSLARFLLRNPKNALQQLHELLKKLAHVLDKTQARKLLELYKGLWVYPEAAAELCCLRHNKQPIAINSMEVEELTGPSYVRRAWPFPQPYKLISAGNSRTLNDIKEILLSVFRQSKKLERYTNPLLLVFPKPEQQESEIFPDENLVEEIDRTYPNITVIVETGKIVPNELTYLTPLEPLLEQGEEDRQSKYFEDIDELIETQI